MFAYCENNPVNCIDSTGCFVEAITADFAVKVVLIAVTIVVLYVCLDVIINKEITLPVKKQKQLLKARQETIQQNEITQYMF